MLLPAASVGKTLRGSLLYQLGAEPLAVTSLPQKKSFFGAHPSQALAVLHEQLPMDPCFWSSPATQALTPCCPNYSWAIVGFYYCAVSQLFPVFEKNASHIICP